MNHPRGKGYLIWQLWRCAGGDPARLAALCVAAGIAWVAIKLHDGPYPHANTKQRPRECVAALRAAGVAVWGWGYIYAVQPVDEAQTAAVLTLNLGLDGYLIDAEHEYKDKRSQSRSFILALRDHLPRPAHSIGFCSYRFPDSHPQIAWDVFLPFCDFHAPQVYPIGNIDPAGFGPQLRESVRQLREKRDLPVVPIGPACPHPVRVKATSPLADLFPVTRVYGDGYVDVVWAPSVAQLDDFDRTVRELALPGAGWWSWEHAEARRDWWAAIAAHGAPPTPPAPPADGVLVDVDRLRALVDRLRAELMEIP